MICHKYKTIFVHIPRTGGTSIELAITGKDWWDTERGEKHLRASEMRKLYGEEIWSSYYKFAFVRNPYDRMVSLWLRRGAGKAFVDFIREYQPMVGEQPSPYYHEIIDEEIDFIGRYESLELDFSNVCEAIGAKLKLPVAKRTENKRLYTKYYGAEEREAVAVRFEKDLRSYGYNFKPSKTAISTIRKRGAGLFRLRAIRILKGLLPLRLKSFVRRFRKK